MALPKWAVYGLSLLGGIAAGTMGYKVYEAYEEKKKTQNAYAPPTGPVLPPAIVNWIPGCAQPLGWSPPAGWSIGSLPPTNAISGWTPPPGWLVGTALPTGFPCPPGWNSTAGQDMVTEEPYTAKSGDVWTLHFTPASGTDDALWVGFRPALKEVAEHPAAVSATKAGLIDTIEKAFGPAKALDTGSGSSLSPLTGRASTGQAMVMGPGGRPRFVSGPLPKRAMK